MKRTEKPKAEVKTSRVKKATSPRKALSPVREEVREDAIRLRAYQLYEATGRRDGHDLENWLQAEKELRGETRKRS
jgi:hypothetical protein